MRKTDISMSFCRILIECVFSSEAFIRLRVMCLIQIGIGLTDSPSATVQCPINHER